MVIKMKSVLFKTLFKNIRYKRRAYSNLQPSIALHDLTLILKCPAFLFLNFLSQETLTPIFNQSQKQKINNQTPKKRIKINYQINKSSSVH